MRLLRLASVVLAILLLLARDASALRWVRVARSGDPAPGLGTAIDLLGPAPLLADDGTLYLVVASSPPAFAFAVYRWSPSSGLVLVEPAPGPRAPTVVANARAEALILDGGGEVSCPDGLEPVATQRVLAPDGSGAHVALARSGDAAPGAPDLRFGDFLSSPRPWFVGPLPLPLLGESRHVAFAAGLQEEPCVPSGVVPRARRALYVTDPGLRLVLLDLEGEPAPGVPGFFHAGFSWSRSALDASGRLTFLAHLLAADGSLAQALYRYEPARGLSLLARTGLPQKAAGKATFESFGPPATNAAGATAFLAALEDGVPRSDVGPRGLWRSDAHDRLQKVYESGEQAPGAPPGVRFAGVSSFATRAVPSGPFLGPTGALAFGEVLEVAPGVYENALFGPDAHGAPSLRVRDGDPAPGIPDARLDALRLLGLGPGGEIAFAAQLVGPGVFAGNDQVWYVLAPGGDATRLLREGDLFDFGTGDPSPALDVSSDPLLDASFDRAAVLVRSPALGVEGIFVTTLPEPGAWPAAVVLAALAATGRRARPSRYAPLP